MVIVGSLAALGLSAVFGAASIAKLRSIPTTRSGFVALGLPRWLVLPVVALELCAALMLLLVPRFGAVLSIALLVGFTLTLGRAGTTAKRSGTRGIRCNCFGSAAEVTGWTFVRNACLLVLAGLALTATRMTVTAPSLMVAGLLAGGGEVVRQLANVRRATGALFPMVPAATATFPGMDSVNHANSVAHANSGKGWSL